MNAGRNLRKKNEYHGDTYAAAEIDNQKSKVLLKSKVNTPKAHIDLIKEQYQQYYHMVRHHTGLSWHIPSFAVAASVLFFGLDSSKLTSWFQTPILPAAGFFIISLFFIVMLVHHRRNVFYARQYSKALSNFERKWGFVAKVHHFQLEPEKNFINRISSSLCLSIFLVFSILIMLFCCSYFIVQVF